ncbi:MAG: AMIN domain-containing protein [Deltaproteobacteria bacterium]|nr:AMIN domain-containing protein [Deltaproteobacteria bacterium]
MKMILFLIMIIVLFPCTGLPQELIKGHYCYTYGHGESLEEARELTRTLAIRNAIETHIGFAEAFSASLDFKSTNDIIQIISSGYLMDIKVIDHAEEGKTICETIEAKIPIEVLKKVVRMEVRKRSKKVEEVGIDNNGYLKILRVVKQTDRYGFHLMAIVKVLRPTGSLHLPSQRNGRPFFKVIMDTFDSKGFPLGSQSNFIHESEVEMLPGEMKTLFFYVPLYTKTFKAWLVGGIKDSGKDAYKKSPKTELKTAAVVKKVGQLSLQDELGYKRLRGVEPIDSEEEFRVEVLADGPIPNARKFFMDRPPRLVIDLKGKWREPEYSVVEVNSSIVRRIRIGKHIDKLRIVIDLKDRRLVTSAIIQRTPKGLTAIIKKRGSSPD